MKQLNLWEPKKPQDPGHCHHNVSWDKCCCMGFKNPYDCQPYLKDQTCSESTTHLSEQESQESSDTWDNRTPTTATDK